MTKGRGVQSVEVGARLLNALVEGGEPMMLRDLARRAELTPAQAHAYLVSFRGSRLVEQDGHAGLYSLGPFALQLGITRSRSFDPVKMASAAVIDLVARTGLTAALSVWGSFGPTVILLEEGVDHFHINSRAGTVYSVSGTATGRTFAAFMPEALVRETIKAELAEGRATRRVGRPVPFAMIRSELARIRAAGLGTIDPPTVPGVNAVAAPVLDSSGQMHMAIALIGPDAIIGDPTTSSFAVALREVTRGLAARLG
jgi:DNA-binding IclR family transcriptional regulator